MIIAGLMGGIGAGLTGAVLAFAAGYGFLGAALVYILAGMLGMSLVVVAVALCPNRRTEDDFRLETPGKMIWADN